MPTKHYRIEMQVRNSTYSTTDNVGTIFIAFIKVIGIICNNNKTKIIITIIINVHVPSPTNRFIIFVDVNVL